MLLKDCPVGSFVRLVSYDGDEDHGCGHWEGEFLVERGGGYGENFVTDGDGDIRDDVYDDEDYQFEIVTPTQSNTITLNGKTYKLKPHTEPRLTVIDGVTYEMEEI